jgi:hypothetical protein
MIDGGPSTKINNRKKYSVMALGCRQTQQPIKNCQGNHGGGMPLMGVHLLRGLPMGVCSLGKRWWAINEN